MHQEPNEIERGLRSFLVEDVHFPYCKGCSHTQVLRAIDSALVGLGIEPRDVDVTTDIGCVGLADALLATPHTVHTTHGRSTAFAVGTVVADRVLARGGLKPIVLVGDGGATIGLLHLVHAAQLNADVTVVLHNNFLFGMTGGQSSALSPVGLVTTTTARGNIVPPLDVCRIAMDAGAGFVARKLASDRDLRDTIEAAVSFPGFALVEVVEVCTAYGSKLNALGGHRLQETVLGQGYEVGVLRHERSRDEFGAAYSSKYPTSEEPEEDDCIRVRFEHALTRRLDLVVSGTAGERVQSSAKLLCRAAAMSGIWSTQKNDNLVTQGTGFSLAEVSLSPEPILYTGADSPDAVVVLSEDGLRELVGRRVFGRLEPDATVVADDGLHLPRTRAKVISIPLRKSAGPKIAAATAVGVLVRMRGVVPPQAYESALRDLYGDQAERCIDLTARLSP